ncbi:MAG TPA: nucleoside phosphorylase [Bacteroidales bacterium]|nr:nucleoside phosphorylase [Bacteroidales bacterium]
MTAKPIPDSQLPLNADGSVYHLKLMPEQVAESIILVGDPNRVRKVSAFFDELEFEVANREIITHTGYYRGKRITVLSTGMGTDNIDIVVHELDALFNIDLKTRIPKPEHTRLKLIRLGTSGALQPDVPVGDSVVASEYALGLDGLLYFYEGCNEVTDSGMTDAFIAHTGWNPLLPHPYVVKASDRLLQTVGKAYLKGVTATAPGFYGPQGRSLRLRLPDKQMNTKIESFAYNGHRITNFEMESSALYGLSRLLGHDALTLCVIIANRVTEKFAPNYHPYMEKLIRTTLDRLAEL